MYALRTSETKRLGGFGALVTVILASAWGNAQEEEDRELADTAKDPVIVLPRIVSAGPGSMTFDGVRVEMSVEGAFRVYRAHHDGQIRTVHEPADGPSQRYAYDPVDRRFAQVTSTLRVRLKDDERLDDVVASTGALRGKNYPALGWALIRLRPDQDPAAVARTLSENPLVMSAEVTLKEPLRVPQ